MNTKNIFKALALAMLMPAMLLTTACSNDDDAVNNENTAKNGYTLPVTINVSRQDDGTTRATYTDNNDGTGTFAFGAGDKLFVWGTHSTAGQFAGSLTWTSGGTFSGTITTEHKWTDSADALFTQATSKHATLLPAGYETPGFISITGTGYSAQPNYDYTKAFALTKGAAVEQFSLEDTDDYTGSGFVLSPTNSILNFSITGLAASTEVAVVFTNTAPNPDEVISKNVTTDGSGNAKFAIAIHETSPSSYDPGDLTLTVGGNAITINSTSKEFVAGHIYNVNRAVTPPTLAQTMTTAGMTVKVKYNYNDQVNYCLFSSNGDGTYTFLSGSGFAGGDEDCAKALVVENGKLVFKQNIYDPIDNQWSNYGFSATFDTSNNTYSNWVGPWAQEQFNPSFISVEVNGVQIPLTQIITVVDLVKENGQSWLEIIANNSGKIYIDGNYVKRLSDGAKLQYSMGGDDWQDVMFYEGYLSMFTYKFEGD